MNDDAIVSCHGLAKTYCDGNASVEVLKAVNFNIHAGERIAIVGPSGSGKSTLLHLLGGLDNPSAGKVLIRGIDWQRLKEKQRCRIRNKYLGFVYQFHHLLPEFTALENVAMPLLFQDKNIISANEEARKMLDMVGLAARVEHKPAQLSGGERQRVAIARALVHTPGCLFADEPTGNLDNATAASVFELMLNLNEQLNTALVIVTHDLILAERMDRVIRLEEGMLLK